MNVHFYKLMMVKEPVALYADLKDKKMNQSSMVYEYAKPYFDGLDREQVLVFALNIKNKIAGVHLVASGSVNFCYANVKEVFKFALTCNAVSVILCHNHLGNDESPSPQDNNMTKHFIEAGRFLDIGVLDHVIVCEDRYFSYADHGLLRDLKKETASPVSQSVLQFQYNQ